jgi:hypothetical protein
MRSLPEVLLSPCPAHLARLAGQGFDSVQEALAHPPTLAFLDLLDVAQKAARDVRDDLEGVVALDLNGWAFSMHATGAKGGFRYRLSNDDVQIFIGSPQREWTVSVRYLSAGLWEHGWHVLRQRVFAALAPYTTLRSDDNVRVSRVDYCFDFFAPHLKASMDPSILRGVVVHSSAKSKGHGEMIAPEKNSWFLVAGLIQTLTIGSKSGLQVELYDKLVEITEKSGKVWLYALWANELGGAPWGGEKPFGMWRLECRFSGEFLKNRNVRRPDELEAKLPALLIEALYTRRLGVFTSKDNNRWRWPMHYLWAEAARSVNANAMLPVGRKVTGRRDALVEQLVLQLRGTLRSGGVLKDGVYDATSVKALMMRALSLVESDPHHMKKVIAAQDRYSDVEEAK